MSGITTGTGGPEAYLPAFVTREACGGATGRDVSAAANVGRDNAPAPKASARCRNERLSFISNSQIDSKRESTSGQLRLAESKAATYRLLVYHSDRTLESDQKD